MSMTFEYRAVVVEALYYDVVDGTLNLGRWKCVSDIIMSDVDCLNSYKMSMTVKL
jgi:hypothetical protein